MGFFDGVQDIDPAGGGNRLAPGQYQLKVMACRVNQGFTGARFIAEFEVLEARGEGATAVGSIASWTVGIDGQWQKIGLGEVSAFWLACQGEDPRATERRPTADDMARAIAGSLEGKVVRSEAWAHKTKGGRDMVKHGWYPANDNATPAPAGPGPPPAPAPAPAAFPPPGWTPHPQAPGYFYRGQEVLSEADLRKRGG
jgi:hypothetical protein